MQELGRVVGLFEDSGRVVVLHCRCDFRLLHRSIDVSRIVLLIACIDTFVDRAFALFKIHNRKQASVFAGAETHAPSWIGLFIRLSELV